ncbi:MAG TPA: CARDB domain-containing protein [Candidatus Thermoplasmatota archaeon]|nr:CARDB domain-containing protein [Candidatus Thermoplasmatota archaeon]
MSLRIALPVALLAVVVAAPGAVAKGGCTLSVDELCNQARDLQFDAVFGDFADIALVVVALVATALVLILLLFVVFHLKVSRLLKVNVSEKVRELEPGGSAKFKLEIENLQPRLPVDLFLEKGDLPEGWVHEIRTAVVLPSGFKMVHDAGESSPLTLGPESKGGHRAVVEVRASAPGGTRAEESIDYELKAVPVFRGKVRKSKAKNVRLTFLVTPHLPKVQISRVVHQPEHITVGSPVLTRAILVNRGDRDANDVAVLFTLNGQEIDKKIVPALGVQGEMEVEFNWTPQSGENRIRVAVGT